MIYYVLVNIVIFAAVLIWLYIERSRNKVLQKRLDISNESNIVLQGIISKKSENEENLTTQMLRWQEIAREEQRRMAEIDKMTVRDHIENLKKY